MELADNAKEVYKLTKLITILKVKTMGYIKEPKGVDFIINSKPLTDKERQAISEFIRQYKAKHAAKKTITKTTLSSSKQKALG